MQSPRLEISSRGNFVIPVAIELVVPRRVAIPPRRPPRAPPKVGAARLLDGVLASEISLSKTHRDVEQNVQPHVNGKGDGRVDGGASRGVVIVRVDLPVREIAQGDGQGDDDAIDKKSCGQVPASQERAPHDRCPSHPFPRPLFRVRV